MHYEIISLTEISREEYKETFSALSPSQQRAVLSKKEDKRASSLAVRVLLYRMLKEHYPKPDLSWLGYSSSGAPCIEGHKELYISFSHSFDKVACAISDRPVGIDVERIRPVSDKTVKRVCTASEQEHISRTSFSEFFTFWTAKEAYIKAAGVSFADAVGVNFFTNGRVCLPGADITAGETDGYKWTVIQML